MLPYSPSSRVFRKDVAASSLVSLCNWGAIPIDLLANITATLPAGARPTNASNMQHIVDVACKDRDTQTEPCDTQTAQHQLQQLQAHLIASVPTQWCVDRVILPDARAQNGQIKLPTNARAVATQRGMYMLGGRGGSSEGIHVVAGIRRFSDQLGDGDYSVLHQVGATGPQVPLR